MSDSRSTADLAIAYLEAWIRVHGEKRPHFSATILLSQMSALTDREPVLCREIAGRGSETINTVLRYVRTAYVNGLVQA